jgi:hypothetical protein
MDQRRRPENEHPMKVTRPKVLIAASFAAVSAITIGRAADVSLAEIRAIAEEGFIFGLPIVMNYAVMYEDAVDPSRPVQGAVQSD